MVSLPEAANVAHTVQLAVAPVFLLAGIGGFLNVLAGRLARIIDRARVIEPIIAQSRGEEHDRLVREIRMLDRRISVINAAILLSVLSACLTCCVVILLFTSQLVAIRLDTIIALLFIASMLSIGIAFATFIIETRLASGVVHIRNELLQHESEE